MVLISHIDALLLPRGAFLGAAVPYEDARACLFGAPLDVTVTFRPGSRLAPQRVREVSDVLEEYSLALNESLDDHPVCDLGDVNIPAGNAARGLEAISQVAEKVVCDGKIPLVLGGEHLITWPVFQAVHRCYPDLTVIHLDAHADLRADYQGERLSHATALRLVADELPAGRLFQFGIRSATAYEVAFARERVRFYPHQVIEPLKACLEELAGRPLYVTIDIDVVDPAFAPGTGTPEPGGITSGELLEAIRALQGHQVVGFDLVEICPPMDASERTAVLGAKALREAILSFV